MIPVSSTVVKVVNKAKKVKKALKKMKDDDERGARPSNTSSFMLSSSASTIAFAGSTIASPPS
jgi:hypothetical protein